MGRITRTLAILLTFCLASIPLAADETAGSRGDMASLALHDMEGMPVSLDQSRGKVVVLNFWATWCIPCREEMPLLQQVGREYAARGVEVIAVSTDDESALEEVDHFVSEQDLDFPVWLGGTVADMHRLKLGDALPATAIIDTDGRIAFRIRGMVTRPMLEERLEFLLGDSSGTPPDPVVDGFEQEVAESEHDHDHGDEGEDHHHEEPEDGSLVPS